MPVAQLKKEEKEFFDQVKDGSYDVFTEGSYRRLLKFFDHLIIEERDQVMLDLGCGSGAFSRFLKELRIPMIGIDLSFNLIAAAKKKIGEVNFLVADAEYLPLAEKSVDLVVFSGFLHHLPDLHRVTKEAYRVLKDEGRCFAYDPNCDNPLMWLYRNKRSPFYSNKGITPNERLLKAKEIREAFSQAGFKVSVFAISGLSYKYIKDRKMALFLPLYNTIEKFFGLMPFSNRYGSFLITLARK